MPESFSFIGTSILLGLLTTWPPASCGEPGGLCLGRSEAVRGEKWRDRDSERKEGRRWKDNRGRQEGTMEGEEVGLLYL